jgi:hypothetical protein
MRVVHRSRLPLKRRSKAPPKAGIRVLGALVVALGLLGSLLVQTAHFAFVQHRLCEHGELSHEDEVPLSSRATAREKHDQPAVDTDSSRAEKAHDHCDALAVRHRLVDAVGCSLGPCTLVSILLQTIGAGSEERPRTMLSLAPKSSPPRI